MNNASKTTQGAAWRWLARLVCVFWAHVCANAWCLLHFGHCVLTHQTKADGCWPQTDRIEAGTGSILSGTWKTAKVFYANITMSCTAPKEDT